MNILAIETSCDETAAAVVQDGVCELASSLATSKELHEKTGGIVPEVAARKQIESILPVLDATLDQLAVKKGFSSRAGVLAAIDALAVTIGPGLFGSLVVGVETAKSLGLVWGKPVVPVNHLLGHLYANFVDTLKQPEFPAIGLVISGGHTDLILMRGHGAIEYLGGTLDDAAGEAFDKTARLLGIAKYLGGPLLSKKAAECMDNTLTGVLPRPMMAQENFDFSFSGLKTAVKRLVETQPDLPIETVACEFENALVDVVVSKTLRTAQKHAVRCILLGGGVSANTHLRKQLAFEAEKYNIPVHVPPIRLCTDNAVYIASAAFFNYKPTTLDKLVASPSLNILGQ